jgi:hypothetical protein
MLERNENIANAGHLPGLSFNKGKGGRDKLARHPPAFEKS